MNAQIQFYTSMTTMTVSQAIYQISTQCRHVETVTRPRTFYYMGAFLYSDTWPFYLTDLLSLRLVWVVGTRTNVRSSYLQRGPTVAWTQVRTVATSALLTTELSHYPTVLYPQNSAFKTQNSTMIKDMAAESGAFFTLVMARLHTLTGRD